MLRYSVSNMEIEIDVNNKIYILGQDSSEGKTYLYQLLRSLQQRPEYRNDLLLITYNSNIGTDVIIKLIHEFKGKLIMMDRVDLYWCKELRDCLEEHTSCPILLDLKSNDYIMRLSATPAIFEWSGNKMEVKKYANDV